MLSSQTFFFFHYFYLVWTQIHLFLLHDPIATQLLQAFKKKCHGGIDFCYVPSKIDKSITCKDI